MKLKSHDLIIFIILLNLTIPCSSAAFCNRTCVARQLPFPFGFSSGCEILLNCTSSGTILAADFPVLSVGAGTIVVNLPTNCHRPVAALRGLFTGSFAPTSRNAILLQDCRNESSDCPIPSTMLQTFKQLDCEANNSTISCYSESEEEGNMTSFIDYENLMRSGCRSLFSSISMDTDSASMDVRVATLGWWLRGACRCSRNAKCVTVSPPRGGGPNPAYRCECIEGFSGDGFLDGAGCRKGKGRNNDHSKKIVLGFSLALAGLITVSISIHCFHKRQYFADGLLNTQRKHDVERALPYPTWIPRSKAIQIIRIDNHKSS